MDWTIERTGPVSTALRISYTQSNSWEQWGLVTADRHLDNPASDRKLQKHHMDQAKDRGAFILDFGDFFDAMQGKSDRRSSKSDLMSRHKSSSYLNDLVEDATDFLSPYAQNIALLGEGNHETSVRNKIEYNLLDGLIYALSRDNPEIMKGGYRGWIQFRFEHTNGGGRTTKNGYYIHGYGGGGPVTKDTIQANRKAVYLPDAHIVFSGHTHDQWWFPIERTRLLSSGREVADTQHHIKIPSYKDEFFNQSGGFHHETGKPPKPKGAWWVRFYYSRRTNTIEVEFIPAEK